MEFVRFKFLLFLFLGVFSPENEEVSSNRLPNVFDTFIDGYISSDGIIVMEDDVMRVDTGDPDNSVDSIEITNENGNKVLSASCPSQPICLIDVKALSDGMYTVVVTTSAGTTFSGAVTIE